MAIIVNSKFKPFTYAELIAPAKEMTDEHKEVEKGLATLRAQAAKWQTKADAERDPIAHAQYQGFANDLSMQADALARRGISSSTRKGMYDMAARYEAEIKPIEEAYNAREKQALLQQEAKLKDPTLLLDREAASTSLDAYLENPSLNFRSHSGAQLAAQAAAQSKAIAKTLTSAGISGKLDAYHYKLLQQYGLTYQDVAEFINNPNSPKANKALRTIVNSTLQASGIPTWENPQIMKEAIDYINMGIWEAVGESKFSPMENYGAKLRAQQAAARAASKSNGAKDQLPAGLKYLSQNKKFLTKKQKNELEDKIQKYVKKGYIATDEKGNIIGINRKGADAYRNARVVVKDKDLQLGTYGTEIQYLTGDGFGTATRHTGFVPKGKGKQITNSGSNPMGDMSKVISHINKVGKQRYGDRFNFGSSDMEFYNMMNELAAMQTGNKNAKAWYGQDDWQIGQWGINQQSKLITDAWKTMHGGEDLIGYNAVQVNVKDSDSERLMSDIAYNTSGSKVNTYTVDSKGQWQIDDDVDKGILNKYKPHSVVTLQDGKPYIELREKALDVNSGQYTNKFSTKGEVIYVPAPSGGHWGNYGNNVQAYYTSQAIVDDYNKQMSTTNTYDGDIEAVLAAYKNIHQDNPNNLIISSERDLLNALGAAGSTTINLGNTSNLGWE